MAARSPRPGDTRHIRGPGIVGPVLAALAVVVLASPSVAPAAQLQPPPGAVDLVAAAPDVAGRPWLARRNDDRWEWGEAGRRGRHLLPAGEAGLAVQGRWLLSTTTGGTVSHLVVRERATGTTVLDVDLPFWVSAAAVTGDRAVLTGYGDSSMTSDAGITVVELVSGVRRVLVAGGGFDPRLGARPMRGDMHVSPNGRLAAVNVCGPASCTTQVADLDRGRVVTVAEAQPGFLRAVTDEVVVLTDGEGRWIRGVDARSGKERYRLADVSLMRPVAMADGSVVASLGLGARGWHLGSIGANGARRELTPPDPESWPRVWPQVSSPSTVVYADETFEEALGRGGDVPAGLRTVPGLAEAGPALVILGQ